MKIKRIDKLILIPIIILNVISLLNMLNAKLISSTYNNAFVKQLMWFIIGYLIILVISKVKFKKILHLSSTLYYSSIILLIIVLIFGHEINGAKCWLNILGFSFQPSEIVKITLLLKLIYTIDTYKLKTKKDTFLLVIRLTIYTLVPIVLVFLEPDTGAVINYLIIFMICLYHLKLNKWWYRFLGIIFTFSIILFFTLYIFYQDILIKLIGTSFFYRIDRLINFANGNSYQLENALITIGAASFFGTGINKILLYIPEAPTDFFFAFSIGNFGVISALIIIFSYILLNLSLIYISHKTKNKNLQMFINSYLAITLFHQIYNIFMNIGLLPIMGIPLPFLSYGGTNTIINFLFIGLIISFNKKKQK